MGSQTNRLVIGFEKLKVFCTIGVHEWERLCEQEVLLDLKIELNTSSNMREEEKQPHISYGDLARSCTSIAREGRFHLIESLAQAILERVFQDPLVQKAKVCVRKPRAIPSAECAYVEMEAER